MAKPGFQERLTLLQYERRLTARQQALMVPWRRLEESASAYVEWQILVLWVRAVCDAVGYVPEFVAEELRSQCPSFLDECGAGSQSQPLWRALWNWIEAHEFAESNNQGWYHAVMFYASENLRSEQAWIRWEIDSEEWSDQPPRQPPGFAEWKRQVFATHSPLEPESERGRAARQLASVDDQVLAEATTVLIESRAFAMWVAAISEPDAVINEVARRELQNRFPTLAEAGDRLVWSQSLLRLLIRLGSARWTARAKSEGWSTALGYNVIHHPRYHRLLHYFRGCREHAFLAGPRATVEFSSWLRAADEYVATTRV